MRRPKPLTKAKNRLDSQLLPSVRTVATLTVVALIFISPILPVVPSGISFVGTVSAGGPTPTFSNNWSVSAPQINGIEYVEKEDLVYATSKDGRNYTMAIYPDNGTVKWNISGVASGTDKSPSKHLIGYESGEVFIANYTDIIVLDSRTGNIKRTLPISFDPVGTVYVDSGSIYIWTQSNRMKKLDKSAGNVEDTSDNQLEHLTYTNDRFISYRTKSGDEWTYYTVNTRFTDFYNDSSARKDFESAALYDNGDGYLILEGTNITYIENDGTGNFTKVNSLSENAPNEHSMRITQDNITWYGHSGSLGSLTNDGEQFTSPVSISGGVKSANVAGWDIAAFGNYTMFMRDNDNIYAKDTGISAYVAPGDKSKISGQVRDQQGNGISGATIYVENSNGNTVTVQTNSGGFYEIDKPDGTYTLKATKKDYFNKTHTVTVSGSDVTQDFVLKPTGKSLQIKTRNYLKHGQTTGYEVWFTEQFANGSSRTRVVTNDATVTSSNTSIITVDQSRNEITATTDIQINNRTNITADYTNGTETYTATQNVTVANATIANLRILPTVTAYSAALGDWTIITLILAGMLGVVGVRVSTAFGGLAFSQSVILVGWFANTVGTGVTMASVFVAMFIGLNLAANIDYQVAR